MEEKKLKYKILRDYYTAGFQFSDGEFDTVDEAVKSALAEGYSVPFKIVVEIPWVAAYEMKDGAAVPKS